jgi:Tfp pilus assembly protein PilV
MRREQGFTVIEVLVAALVLVVGILGLFMAFSAAGHLTLVAERQASMAHRGQQEVERLQSLTYKQLAMTATPSVPAGCPSPLTAQYPTSPDCFVSNGSPPAFKYDRTNTSNSEALVIDTANGTVTPNASGCTDGCTGTWTDGHFSGEIFDFITSTSDPNCSSGSICPATSDYKRVTVIVTVNGAAHPAQPLLTSTIIADPDAIPVGAPSNSNQNPLQDPSTQCGGRSCNQALNGTASDYYLTDSPYSSPSYSAPTASHALHQTLTSCGSNCNAAPDQLITTVPPSSASSPLCYSNDLGCAPANGYPTGLLLKHPNSDSSSCGSPPVDNTKSHAWVTAPIPGGTSLALTGAGGMTLYLESGNGSPVNAVVCASFFSLPNSQLGTSTTLLPPNATQIGGTVSTNARVGAGVPTPVSAGFNLGGASTLTSTSADPLRIEVVVWLGASSGTDITLSYDDQHFPSQLTLIHQ